MTCIGPALKYIIFVRKTKEIEDCVCRKAKSKSGCCSIENHIPNKPFPQECYLLKIRSKRHTPAIEQVNFIKTDRVQSVTEDLAVDQISKSRASDHFRRHQNHIYFCLDMFPDVDVLFCCFFFSYAVDSLCCKPKIAELGLLNTQY